MLFDAVGQFVVQEMTKTMSRLEDLCQTYSYKSKRHRTSRNPLLDCLHVHNVAYANIHRSPSQSQHLKQTQTPEHSPTPSKASPSTPPYPYTLATTTFHNTCKP